MYKINTGIIAEFVIEHFTRNGIVTDEQAEGKRGSWGCVDQLLINKMIYKEVKERIKNLLTVWLDYKKAFDSIPHSWIIKSLQLAKIPDIIIEAIRMIMTKWRSKLHLYGESNTIESLFIDYMRGILQGDLLSLILFVLSVNSLSYILSKEKGYTLNLTNRGISHLFFVDDLKLYGSTWIKMMKLLDIVTQFTKDENQNARVR